MSDQNIVQQAWQAASDKQTQAQADYPELGCLSGCNDCCKHHGSPMTYAQEWDCIADWLAQHPQVYQQARIQYTQLKQTLQVRLAKSEVPTISGALFEAPCPFLQDERCAVYPVRPMTCRAFGNTTLAPHPSSGEQIYTCNPEKDRWEQLLPMLQEPCVLPERTDLFAPLANWGQPRSLLSWLERAMHADTR
ncbi:MAG: YkgJ family cysteine cluster protein [Candidatus Sericytochromatia bacterium]|nr:YkgJ family cysteine cluster protein [Candidatus Sericytochromatia bacterium]